MFDRILYIDDQIALCLSWFGMGALKAKNRVGAIRRAHPLQRKAFLIACQAFTDAGQPLLPSNPKCSELMKDFAEMLLYQSPSSMTWGMVFDDPAGFGRMHA